MQGLKPIIALFGGKKRYGHTDGLKHFFIKNQLVSIDLKPNEVLKDLDEPQAGILDTLAAMESSLTQQIETLRVLQEAVIWELDR